ncbi:MAG: hypothetical protein J6S67_20830 [Methanobrevibacter sp.]|nr:hypothetical protein [Methanobrevibacter sp.]
MDSIQSFEFNGMRVDLGDKLLDTKYFFNVVNYNENDIIGANKVLAPAPINKIQFVEDAAIDGIYGFSYLNQDNKLQNERIIVTGGKIFSQIGFNTKQIYDGFETGLCDFAFLNDKLFITNGKHYPLVYNGNNIWEMGAPEVLPTDTNGGLIGTYYYEITYVTAGGEERIGTRSNSITLDGKCAKLNIPQGYDGTTARKIYRTEGNGENLKLVDTINDNETLTYTDNKADSALGNAIPKINNECPKPYFLETANFRLIGCVSDKYPTQAWVADTNLELFDGANFTDVSNRTKDNSKLTGMKRDYDKIIITSQKQVYILDVTEADKTTVTETRSNVGCLNGYSMARIPSDKGFEGGILFLASDKTIRLFNGNFAQPVATSLDNLRTDNYGEAIRPILVRSINNSTTMYAEYYDFKYHLIVGNIMLVYDIRTNSWFTYDFLDATLTGDYAPENYDKDYFLTGTDTNALFNCFAVIDNIFYVGRKDCSFIEQMYSTNIYRNKKIKSRLEFPYWGTSEELKYFKEIHIYYQKNSDIDFDVTINLDGGGNYSPQAAKSLNITDKTGGDYDDRYFGRFYYESKNNTEDYRVIHVNKYANWIKVIIESNDKPLNFRGMRIVYQKVTNKEVA